MRETRLSKVGVDATLRCQTGDLLVHSVVASAISPVLCAALTGDFKESVEKVIDLPDSDAATVEFALDFYCGSEAIIDGESATKLLALADQLQMEPLRAACETYLRSMLTTSNAAIVAEAAASHGCPDLAEAAQLLQREDTSVLRELVDHKQRLLQDQKHVEEEIKALRNKLSQIRSSLVQVQGQHDFELEEQLRRRKPQASESATVFPHPPGRTLIVCSNADSQWNWKSSKRRKLAKKKAKNSTATTDETDFEFQSVMEAYGGPPR